MAEIPVEKKSSRTWLWLLLAAILVVLLIWWLSSGNDNVVDEDAVATAPSLLTEAKTPHQSQNLITC